jgi:hypothetical protein
MAGAEQRGGQPQDPKREFVDKVEDSLKKREKRQRNRTERPVMAHLTRHQHQNLEFMRREFKQQLDGTEPEEVKRLRAEASEELLQFFRNRRIARADLTPEELEHQELLDNISRLKRERTMSGRINVAEEDIEDEQLTQMQQIEPEFMTPIITGLQKRPERKAKAERAIQRIRQKRSEDQSHE